MDGINGMTALYSIILFITFYLLCSQNEFININLIEIMVFSLSKLLYLRPKESVLQYVFLIFEKLPNIVKGFQLSDNDNVS